MITLAAIKDNDSDYFPEKIIFKLPGGKKTTMIKDLKTGTIMGIKYISNHKT